MALSNYASRKIGKQMKLLVDYETLAINELIAIINGGTTLQRHVAAMKLQMQGGPTVLDYAKKLCMDSRYNFREIGVFILGQIELSNHDDLCEVEAILIDLGAGDKSVTVRTTALYSLGHRYSKGLMYREKHFYVLDAAVKHPSASIRCAVAFALAYVDEVAVLPLLAALLEDSDEDVRDWAGFAVNNTGADSVAIRLALVNLLNDPSKDIRYEAITALAARQDMRVKNALIDEIFETPDEVLVEAAVALTDPQLIPVLISVAHKRPNDDYIQQGIEKLKEIIAHRTQGAPSCPQFHA